MYLSDFEKNSRPQVLAVNSFPVPKIKDDDEDEKEKKRLIEFLERLKKHTVTYGTQGNNAYLTVFFVNVAASLCYSCKIRWEANASTSWLHASIARSLFHGGVIRCTNSQPAHCAIARVAICEGGLYRTSNCSP